MAAFGLDVLWPLFIIAGLEVVRIDPGNTKFTPLDFVSYPWSHSLAMSLVWGAVAAAVTFAGLRTSSIGTGHRRRGRSHWVLDWISHRPDMPLWPGGPVLGLGLWNSIPGTVTVEGALFAAGIALYVGATRRGMPWGVGPSSRSSLSSPAPGSADPSRRHRRVSRC